MNNNYYISGSNPFTKSNMGYFETSKNIYFFDTTYDTSYFHKEIMSAVSKGKKITLVLSHKHKDHYNGLSTDVINYIDSVIASDEFSDELRYIHSLQIIKKSEIILEKRIRVFIVLNGHTTKDIILCNLQDKVVFMGDLLLEKRHPLLSIKNVDVLSDVYKKMLRLGLKKFIPGHGNIVSDVELYKYIEYLCFLKENQKKYMEEKTLNVEELLEYSKYNDWKYPENFKRSITQIV